jgi:hypothetical protein
MLKFIFSSSAEHRKLRKHQVEAEDDLQKFKMEKLQKALEQGVEKKLDFQMLQEYHPWGRPGHGAPKVRNTYFHGSGSDLPKATKAIAIGALPGPIPCSHIWSLATLMPRPMPRPRTIQRMPRPRTIQRMPRPRTIQRMPRPRTIQRMPLV